MEWAVYFVVFCILATCARGWQRALPWAFAALVLFGAGFRFAVG